MRLGKTLGISSLAVVAVFVGSALFTAPASAQGYSAPPPTYRYQRPSYDHHYYQRDRHYSAPRYRRYVPYDRHNYRPRRRHHGGYRGYGHGGFSIHF